MRVAFVLAVLVVGLAAQAGLGAGSSPVRTRTVPCDEIVDLTRFPHRGNAQPRYRSRVVLGAFSVPPALIPQTSPTGERPWRFFGKWGMVVRADGRVATVTVPRSWRNRVAISWGNAGHGVFQSIRFAGCRHGRGVGNAYAGGFFFRARTACVPLIFRVGGRQTVFRFGLGRRCA